MGNNNLFDELDLLASGTDRPDAKRLREIIERIETYLSRGVRRNEIYAALKKDDFKFTYKSFLVTLSRIRKEERNRKNTAVPVAAAVPVTPALAATQVTPFVSNPLHVLSGKPKEGEFNPNQTVNFELDDFQRK